jgi:hypothetical protein
MLLKFLFIGLFIYLHFNYAMFVLLSCNNLIVYYDKQEFVFVYLHILNKQSIVQ